MGSINPRRLNEMRLLLTLIVAFCLVSSALTKPLPEGDETSSDGTEEPQKEGEDHTEEDQSSGGTTVYGSTQGEQTGSEDGEGKTSDDDAAKQEDGGSGGSEGGKESSPDSKDGGGEAKNNPAETYAKVVELLDKSTKIEKVDNNYLQSGLTSDLQTYVRNPIIDAIGTVGDFSKISDCFKSLDQDVKSVIDKAMESFKACTAKKETDEYHCANDRSAGQEQLAKMSSQIATCASSKR